MIRFALAGSLFFVSMTGLVLADEKDFKELEGTYSVVGLEKGGSVAKKEVTSKITVAFKGDSFILAIVDDGKKEEKTAKIKIDAAKQPHTIDITPIEGPEKGKTFPGIYKFDKGELTLAFTEKQGADRPKEFKAEENVILMKMKKE